MSLPNVGAYAVIGGSALPGATITNSQSVPGGSAVCDSSGSYLIAGIPGPNVLTATLAGFSFSGTISVPIQTIGDRIAGANFQAIFTISGQVTKAGVSQTSTPVQCASNVGLRQTISDASGNFSFQVFSTDGGQWVLSSPTLGRATVTVVLGLASIAALSSVTFANANLLN